MIQIDTKKEYDLNNSNVAAQNIQLGTYLKEINTKISGSSPVWDDLFFPLTTAKQGQTDKPAFDPNGIGYLYPPSDTTQIMYMIAQMPHSWAQGTNIDPHVHWKQESTGSPVFKMDYKWFPIGGSVPDTYSTFVMANKRLAYTSGSMHQLNSGSAMISGSNITGVSSIMIIKLYRDDNAYAGNALVYQFDIHYLKDGFGSFNEFTK